MYINWISNRKDIESNHLSYLRTLFNIQLDPVIGFFFSLRMCFVCIKMDVDEWPCKKQSVGGTHRRVIKKNKNVLFPYMCVWYKETRYWSINQYSNNNFIGSSLFFSCYIKRPLRNMELSNGVGFLCWFCELLSSGYISDHGTLLLCMESTRLVFHS